MLDGFCYVCFTFGVVWELSRCFHPAWMYLSLSRITKLLPFSAVLSLGRFHQPGLVGSEKFDACMLHFLNHCILNGYYSVCLGMHFEFNLNWFLKVGAFL